MSHPPLRFVTRFEQVGPYVLRIAFDDGVERTIDFLPVLRGGVLGALRDPETFRRVRLDPEHRNLVWPNDVDFDPSTLHDWPSCGPAMAEAAARWGDRPSPPIVEQRVPDPEPRASSEAGPLPEICRFYGIVILMYWEGGARHHAPHFHARYGDHHAVFALPGGEILRGTLPRAQRRLVEAWLELHRDELLDNWARASSGEPPRRIAPLR